MSEQIKARLEAVGVSEVDVSAPCLNCALACAPLLLLYQVSSSSYIVLSHLYTHAFKCMCACMCACVHLLITSRGQTVYCLLCVCAFYIHRAITEVYKYKSSLNIYVYTGVYLNWKHFFSFSATSFKHNVLLLTDTVIRETFLH